MKRIVICGATSGIGKEIAKHCIEDGNIVGVAGRRSQLLDDLKALGGERVFTKAIDVTAENASEMLMELVNDMGGMDVYIHVSGIGSQNLALESGQEMNTVNTNCMGFTRMVTAAFNHLAQKGGGHIAAVTSIAGTKGLGVAPSYSATKRYQSHYLQCLSQLSRIRNLGISVTDIRPGFVATELLQNHYPITMQKEPVGAAAYAAICSHKRVKIIDWRFAAIVNVWRMVPNCLWEKMKIGKPRKK